MNNQYSEEIDKIVENRKKFNSYKEYHKEIKTDFIKDLVKIDENNQIIINNKCETSHPGIFAAGDVTNTPFKQMIVAAGDGAKAGLNSYNYLHDIKSTIIADWKKGK